MHCTTTKACPNGDELIVGGIFEMRLGTVTTHCFACRFDSPDGLAALSPLVSSRLGMASSAPTKFSRSEGWREVVSSHLTAAIVGTVHSRHCWHRVQQLMQAAAHDRPKAGRPRPLEGRRGTWRRGGGPVQTACLRSRNLLDDKYSIFCSCPTSSVSIRACGVVVSRIVCIDKVSGSNPDESKLELSYSMHFMYLLNCYVIRNRKLLTCIES